MSDDQEQFDMKSLFQEISSIKDMQKSAIDSNSVINKKLDTIQNTLCPIQEEVVRHTREIKYLDVEKRRKNVIIFGLQQNSDETYDMLERQIIDLISNTFKINNFSISELDFIRRIRSRSDKMPRPVLVGFTTQRRKIEILKMRRHLKGTNIYINEDCSPEVIQQEKALRGEMNRLRKEGKYAVIRTGKLIVFDKNTSQPGTSRENANKRAHSESPNSAHTHIKRVNMNISSGSSLISDFESNMEAEDITPEEVQTLNSGEGTGAGPNSVIEVPSQSVLAPAKLTVNTTVGTPPPPRSLSQPCIDNYLNQDNSSKKN